MEDFLEEIYQKAELFTVANEIVDWSDCNSVSRVTSILKEKQPFFKVLYNENNALSSVIEKIFQHADDKNFTSDLIRMKFLPRLDQYLKQYQCIEVDADDGYRLVSSAHGFLTLKDGGNLMHSSYDPMLEARDIVLELFDTSKSSYSLLGCGLGYIAYQLYYISGGSVKIRVFEPNEYVASYAQKYGVLSWIPEENIEIIINQDIVPFLESVQDDKTGYYIFVPELKRWVDDVQNIVSELVVDQNTRRLCREFVEINFYQNLLSNCKNIEDLPAICKNNKCIVVAGGPSLDDNIDFIKNNRENMTVITVGTSFKKLVKLGLKPDFVTIIDPTKLIMKQLEGVEDEDTKLVAGTCAYWGWVRNYNGDKYLVPILDNTKQQLIWSQRSKTSSWYCGGTVTYLATKLAVYLGSKEIYLVGADFAFPGNVTHAVDTPFCVKINTDGSGFMDTVSVNGENVKTDVPFNMFREQMEELIKSRKDIKFYNMSTVGAYIKGTLDGRELK